MREIESFPAHKFLEEIPREFVLDFEGVCGLDKVTADLSIQNSGEEYFVQGDVAARVHLECARCLAEFVTDVVGRADFVICSESLLAEHKGEALDSEDYVLFKGSSLMVDITEPIRQAILLAISMKPLCSDDCRGICPHCGVNLNEGECSCPKEKIDSRWEALKKLTGE